MDIQTKLLHLSITLLSLLFISNVIYCAFNPEKEIILPSLLVWITLLSYIIKRFYDENVPRTRPNPRIGRLNGEPVVGLSDAMSLGVRNVEMEMSDDLDPSGYRDDDYECDDDPKSSEEKDKLDVKHNQDSDDLDKAQTKPTPKKIKTKLNEVQLIKHNREVIEGLIRGLTNLSYEDPKATLIVSILYDSFYHSFNKRSGKIPIRFRDLGYTLDELRLLE
jgi:hypothetical protein